MQKIKCIVVEDEIPALEKLLLFAADIPFLDMVASFSKGKEGLEYAERRKPDLVFLDIQLDDINGLTFIDKLSYQPIIILTTAFSSYAVESFQFNVCDYLLKPYIKERFNQATSRALTEYYNRGGKALGRSGELTLSGLKRDFVFVKTAFKFEKIELADILYLKGMKEYIMFCTKKGNLMSHCTFKEVEDLLPATDFFRIHKSYVVAINKIDTISNKRAVVGREYLPISNTYYDSFIQYLRNNSILM